MIMKIYLAGSFPRMTTKPLEYELSSIMVNNYSRYRRLYSFFYAKESTCAIEQLIEGGVIEDQNTTKDTIEC